MSVATAQPASPADVQVERVDVLPEGEILAERYRILSVLGDGGMGTVYLAEHTHMRNVVAVKVLHPSLVSHAEIVARFEREAIAAGQIDHPNVAAAKDFGRLANGSFYLVLEHVPGRTLRTELEHGAIAVERSLSILRGINAAVSAAHSKGIIHRDLKPENIMLTDRDGDSDFVKVLDFGIAKLDRAMLPNGSSEPLTRLGAVFGTPEYMAPEQALGQAVDARADLYAIGIILYEMLSGNRPFEGDAVLVLRSHVLDELPPLPDVNPALSRILRQLLAKDPNNRFQSAAELDAALASQQLGVAKTVCPINDPNDTVSKIVPIRENRSRSRAVVVAGMSIIFVGAAALGWILIAGPSNADATPNEKVASPSQTFTDDPMALPARSDEAKEPASADQSASETATTTASGSGTQERTVTRKRPAEAPAPRKNAAPRRKPSLSDKLKRIFK